MIGRWASALLLCGCSNAVTPRYASWEPVLESIQRPASYADAKRRLTESHGLWQKWSKRQERLPAGYGREWLPSPLPPSYSYVRARQLSEKLVAFTVLVVAGGKVVLRAYATADPDHLSSLRALPAQRDVRTIWVERGLAVGLHQEGAPAFTIDQLYAACASSIAEAEAASAPPPRLYFHPHGLLMQCGYPARDCDDCETVAIQDVSRFSLAHETPADDLEPWTCATEQGLVLPLSPTVHGALTCLPIWRRDPHYAERRAAEHQARLAEACAVSVLECEEFENQTAGVGDICEIDPAVCGLDGTPHAHFQPLHFHTCSSPAFARPALPLEVGKLEPLHEWSFPAYDKAFCGLEPPPARPPGRLRYVRQTDGNFMPVFTR